MTKFSCKKIGLHTKACILSSFVLTTEMKVAKNSKFYICHNYTIFQCQLLVVQCSVADYNVDHKLTDIS
jgi:hypothetical protein